LGVEIDYREAAKWYRASAEHGDTRGEFDLASLYMAGTGVPLDYVSAYLWYSLAASAGDNRSAHQVKSLARLMTLRQIREAQTRLSDRQRQERPSGESDDAGLGAAQPRLQSR